MPATDTITSTDMTTFVTRATITSAGVNNNFSVFRGHFLPVDPTTSAAVSSNYDLGSTTYQWRTGYINSFGRIANTTGSFTALKTDRTLLINNTAGAVTVTLPTAVSIAGKEIYIKKVANTLTAVTIDANGTETIDSTLTVALQTFNESIKIASDGANWHILERMIVTQWIAYTPTTQGFGTIATVQFFWRRVGDSIEVQGKFTGGTPTAVEARIGLPTGLTSSGTEKIGAIRLCGKWGRSSSGLGVGHVLIEPSVTYFTFADVTLAKDNGNGLIGAGVDLTMFGTCPIVGWEA